MGNVREFAGYKFKEIEYGVYIPIGDCKILASKWYRTKDCIGFCAIAIRTGQPPVMDIKVICRSDNFSKLRNIYNNEYQGIENISIGYEVVDWERGVRGVRV